MEHQMIDAANEAFGPRDDIRERTFRFMTEMLFDTAVLGGLKDVMSESARDANNDETKELLEKAAEHIGDAIEAVNNAITANNKELAKIKPEKEG